MDICLITILMCTISIVYIVCIRIGLSNIKDLYKGETKVVKVKRATIERLNKRIKQNIKELQGLNE